MPADFEPKPQRRVTLLVPRHEVVPYLQSVPNIRTPQVQFITNLVIRTSDEIVASVFGDTAQLAKGVVQPNFFEDDVRGLQRYTLNVYDEFHAGLLQTGRSIDQLTSDDIPPGGLQFKYLQMSRDQYLQHTEELVQEELGGLTVGDELRESLGELKEHTRVTEYKRLLRMLRLADSPLIHLTIDNKNLLLKHYLFTIAIAKRLSPSWRELIQNNPYMDPELASVLHGQGEDLMAPERAKQLVLLGDHNRRTRQAIQYGQLSRSELKQAIIELTANNKTDRFVVRRLQQLADEPEIPYKEISEILRLLS